jgi:ubiquinone/menaquinone biosynthesis C-methylase UbiE
MHARTIGDHRNIPGYTLGTSTMESDRLREQADDLLPHSRELFATVGVEPGWRALDLGCGPIGNLGLLAKLTGPGGSVLGMDVNPENLVLASDFARSEGLGTVSVKAGDARATGLASSFFDLVHARLLLINVPCPGEVLAEMVRLVRPGGWVTSEEADAIFVCYPCDEAWDRLCALLLRAWRLADADISIGRRLPEMYRMAGLQDIGFRVYADAHPAGHRRRMIVPDLVRSLRPKIIGSGLITERELDELDAAARTHIEDPRTVLAPMLYVTAWGRKPL